MKKTGLSAINAGKQTSVPCKWHQKYPYLLKDKAIRIRVGYSPGGFRIRSTRSSRRTHSRRRSRAMGSGSVWTASIAHWAIFSLRGSGVVWNTRTSTFPPWAAQEERQWLFDQRQSIRAILAVAANIAQAGVPARAIGESRLAGTTNACVHRREGGSNHRKDYAIAPGGRSMWNQYGGR